MTIDCPVPHHEDDVVLLGHGSGGRLTAELLDTLVLPALDGHHGPLEDAALLPGRPDLVISTDSFVVSPLFFPGGDIGSLSVYGTVNDLAMRGARPVALSVALIIEEGLPLAELRSVVESLGKAARDAGVPVVTGDTKVVGRGAVDKIFVNTTGVGHRHLGLRPSAALARPGDAVLLSGPTFSGAESPGVAADTGFRFVLADLERHVDNAWHNDRQHSSYRAKTRRGGVTALNVWLVDSSDLGVATFPWEYADSPKIDGVRVHYDSLPGRGITNYSLGKTLVHEAGHWLGLYHTFQGGCSDLNDEVTDTVAQGGPTKGCPVVQDTCVLPGTDPVHNYMDYSYDACYSEFTPGQALRMQQMATAYRS